LFQIINEVLSYLPLKSLLTCRLVNRTFNAQAVPWIQKKLKLAFVTSDEFTMFSDDFDSADVLPLQSLKIILQEMSLEHCHKFFRIHGSSLRNLESHETNWDQKPDESHFKESLKKLQYILRHASNMKRLSLNFADLPKLVPGLFDFGKGEKVTLTQVERLMIRWTGSLSKRFLNGLVTLLPNLKIIQLDVLYTSENVQDWKAFSKFLQQCLSLQTLYFTTELEHPETRALFRSMTTKGSPKLQELKIYVRVYLNTINNNYLRLLEAQEEFLSSQSNNLEVLRFVVKYVNTRSNEIDPAQQKRQFPAMTNLRTATFDNLAYNENPASYPYFPLEPEHLPNLRTLCVVPKTMESEVFADSIFTSVQDITLLKWHHSNLGLLPKIGSRFPNLRKLTNLEIPVDANAMRTIVTNFSEIEDLELEICDRRGEDLPNFNLVIGGVPAEKWALARDQWADCSGFDFLFLPTWIDPLGPSLRDLRCKYTITAN